MKYYKQSKVNQLVWYFLHLLDNKNHQELLVNHAGFCPLKSESLWQRPGNQHLQHMGPGDSYKQASLGNIELEFILLFGCGIEKVISANPLTHTPIRTSVPVEALGDWFVRLFFHSKGTSTKYKCLWWKRDSSHHRQILHATTWCNLQV